MEKININRIFYFRKKLLFWFEKHGRDFPWRNDQASKYLLIISEILLQRTKAETVSNFLPVFIKQYPSWESLWKADQEDLYSALKPIGLYKQRGDRLIKLAHEIKRRNGEFPRNRNEIEEMPMMGQYITNAYELYVLNKKKPLLDVNMARLLERYFGPRKLADIRYDKYLQDLSHMVVNVKKSKELNWAILDYASLLCTKNNPKCSGCILQTKCDHYHKSEFAK